MDCEFVTKVVLRHLSCKVFYLGKLTSSHSIFLICAPVPTFKSYKILYRYF
jgi:hypothetical protein